MRNVYLALSFTIVAACSGTDNGGDNPTGGAGGAVGGTSGVGGAGGRTESGGTVGNAGTGGRGATGGMTGTGGNGAQGGATSCAAFGESCANRPCCGPYICVGNCMAGVSDRNLKQDFTPIEPEEILDAVAELPISTWTYKDEPSKARHMGPMAQDFMASFHVGSSDKFIYQVDADGVALAAIQALNERVKRLAEQNAALSQELANIRVQLSRGHALPRRTTQLSGNAK